MFDGNELKARLKQVAKPNIRAFSRRLDEKYSRVYAWVSPGTKTLPPVLALVKIAHAANVTLDWLVLGRGPMRPSECETPVGADKVLEIIREIHTLQAKGVDLATAVLEASAQAEKDKK